MAKKDMAAPAALTEVFVIQDEELLTPKEKEQELKAHLEDLAKLRWMQSTPEQLTSRIPVSVFAMGDLVANG